MDISSMKNMVVLKNLPSNLIDEAIVILKANKNVKKPQYIETNKKTSYEKSVNQKDYIVKEAEEVISNYISKIETNKVKTKDNIMKKYKKLKIYSICVTIVLVINIIRTIIA